MIKNNNTALQLARQIECAKAAGIYHATFLAFGGLLGCVRHNGFLPGDDDLDIGFISEMITADQENEYFRLLRQPTKDFPEHGLFEYREKSERRQDNGRFFWISVRGKPAEECYKCCHWFFWTSHGYTWHCKGRGALVKGIPEGYLEIGPEVEFMGSKIHIPKRVGSVLDFWYTDWWTPRSGGNSARKAIFEISDWQAMSGNIKEQSLSTI